MPKVTIGLPFYHDVQFIKDAIQSVIKQTYTDWELIVVDDGGNDGSLGIAKTIIDKRVKIISDGKNLGLPSRLNQTISIAKGEYYFRMDADDIMIPERVEQQVRYLETHKDVDVVGAKSIIIDEQNRVIYQSKKGGHAPQNRQDVIQGNVFIHPTVAGRTDWFKAHPYDEMKSRSQDFFLWLETVESSHFALIDQPLLFYRITKENILGKFLKNNKLMQKYYYEEFMNKKSSQNFRNWMKQVFRRPVFYLYHTVLGDEGIVKRRYDSLSIDEKKHYNDIINQIV